VPTSLQQHYNAGVSGLEAGGHLISVSEDGTLAVTNLNSGEIHKLIHGYSTNDRDKRKIDSFMHERNKNLRERRRHSIH
jgi:hypothetical protein